MEYGNVSVAELVEKLRVEETVFYRMALYYDSSDTARWHVHSLLIDALPTPFDHQSNQPFVFEYGDVVAVGSQERSEAAALWLIDGYGRIRIPRLMPEDKSFDFSLPPFASREAQSVSWNRHFSGTQYYSVPVPWPFTEYQVGLTTHPVPVPNRRLAATGCPPFLDFFDLVSQLVHGARSKHTGYTLSRQESVIVRIAQTEAWIDAIREATGAFTVIAKGTNLTNVRVQIPALAIDSLLEDVTDERDSKMQIGHLDIPWHGDQSLLITLTQGNRWLDERHLKPLGSPDVPQSDDIWTLFGSQVGTVSVMRENPVFGPAPNQVNERLAFVLMPFSPELTEVYNSIVKPALDGMGLESRRADELASNTAIIQDIWKAICAARIVVADLTGLNPNVMYELGIAHALGKDTILLYQSAEEVKFPFDLAHIRRIEYLNTAHGGAKLREALVKTITTIL